MIERIKLMMFETIYEDLNIQSIEKTILEAGVKPKQIENTNDIMEDYQPISQYFFLKNEIQLNNLTNEEQNYLQGLYNNYINNIDNSQQSLYNFLRDYRTKLLIPQTTEKYMIWDNNMSFAPTDAFVLDFHYIEFDDDYDEKREEIVDMCLNKIQDDASTKNMKVAVLKQNEIINNTYTI